MFLSCSNFKTFVFATSSLVVNFKNIDIKEQKNQTTSPDSI